MPHTVLHYLESTAARFPDKPAVTDEAGSITFSGLRRDALRLAAAIRARLDGASRLPVLVYLPKSKESIVSFMGIVYSGNFYTPTDVRFPFPKVKSVIDCLRPALIVTDEKNAAKLRENGVAEEQILLYGEAVAVDAAFDVNAALSRIIDTDPVYIFFTSGSTGVPKGVIISHRNIIDYIEWAVPACGITELTRMGNQSPFYFDIATQDIYSCIKTSAQLFIIPEHFFSFPAKLLSFIHDSRINYLYWVPSAFVNVATRNVLEKIDISCVKQIIFGGEVMPVKHLRKWQNYVPGLSAMNVYGPTEATVNITHYYVNREFSDDDMLPLGFPCGNTGLLLLDSEDALITQPGIQGELCVRGSSLALGYWNNPEKTFEAFVQNPLNPHYPEKIYRTGDLAHYNERGELMFDGRKDFQIKHMGHRIELGEIEAAALSLDGVSAASADYDTSAQQIVLFYSGKALERKVLQKSLTGLLPKYMVPARYVELDVFPYNDNGKIDRRKLRAEYIEVKQ